MTNYDKKRNRHKDGSLSEREREYMKGYYAGLSDNIHRLVESGVLPAVDFMKPYTQEEFKK